jgi:hypothetical protein
MEIGLSVCDDHKDSADMANLFRPENNPAGAAQLMEAFQRSNLAAPDLDDIAIEWREL